MRSSVQHSDFDRTVNLFQQTHGLCAEPLIDIKHNISDCWIRFEVLPQNVDPVL